MSQATPRLLLAGSPGSIAESAIQGFVDELRAGGDPSVEAVQRRIAMVSEVYPATLNRLGNLFMLSGVAGTMMALFRFATEVTSSVTVGLSPKQYLLNTFSHAFSAFAVTIFGVSLGAFALLTSHFVRTRLQRRVLELGQAMTHVRGELAVRRLRPEELFAQDLRGALADLSGTLERTSRENTTALACLNVDLGQKLAPLGNFEELFGGLRSSVQQMTKFVKGQGDLIDMMQSLRGTADALRDTAASLPQAYRDHTTTAISELKGFSVESEQSLLRINENIGQIASFVADVPERVKRILESSVDKYNDASLGAFQTHVERIERIGAQASRQMPEVEAALEKVEQRAIRTQSAVDELAVRLNKSLSRIEASAEALQAGLSAHQPGPSQRTMPWVAPMLAAFLVIAVLGAGPADRWLQRLFSAPGALSSTFKLVQTVPGRSATVVVDGQALVVPLGASFGSDQAILAQTGVGYALVRSADGALRALWASDTAQVRGISEVQLESLAAVLHANLPRAERLARIDGLVQQLGRCSVAEQPLLVQIESLFLDADDAVAAHTIHTFERIAPLCKADDGVSKQIAQVLMDGAPPARLAIAAWLNPVSCAAVPWPAVDAAASASDESRQEDAVRAATVCKKVDAVPMARKSLCASKHAPEALCAPAVGRVPANAAPAEPTAVPAVEQKPSPNKPSEPTTAAKPESERP